MFASYFFDEMIKFNILMIKLIIFIVVAVFKIIISVAVIVFKFIYETIYNIYLNLSSKKHVEQAEKSKYTFITDKNILSSNENLDGFIFGTYNNNYVVKKINEYSNVLVIGGTGSGKTSCTIIPTLQNFTGNAFVIDIKGELYTNTVKYRKSIKVLNPADTNTYGYNPYFLISSSNFISDIRDIVFAILPTAGKESEIFWVESSQNLLTAIIIYCYRNNKSFIETIDFILDNDIRKILITIKNSTVDEAKIFINAFLNIEDKILLSIYLELANKLAIFSVDKDLRNCLSNKKTIKAVDLEYCDVYIQITEDKIEQYKNFFNLIVSQFLKYFEKRETNKKEILFILDEFARLGKVNNILNALTTLRSRNISLCLVIQSIAQLDLIYSENMRRVICDNCSYKAVLNATDTTSQKYISELIGTYEKVKITRNKSVRSFSISETTEEKNIIKPAEIPLLMKNDKLILITPTNPYIINKKPYYL